MGRLYLILALLAVGIAAVFVVPIIRRKVTGDDTKSKGSILYKILGIVLVAYVTSMIIVLLWGAITSFKDPLNDFDYNIIGLPHKFYLGNFVNVFKYFKVPVEGGYTFNFVGMFINSIMYAVGNSVIRVCVLFIVAYAAARFKFLVGRIIYGVVIVGMILPIVGAQPSMIRVADSLGLYDSFWGMYIQKANFMGMHFLILHATLAAFPKDYDEAAQIDGASNLAVMFRIMWPLAMTTFATILLLNFITEWNDYSTPMLFLPNHPTVAYGLQTFNGGKGSATDSDSTIATYTPVKLAACFLSALPTLILFMIFHDKLLNNLSIGGVKE